MAGVREQSRARTMAAILAAAREEIATRGGGGLSMRAVAREVGMVSSAVYRYFPTREALLTAMILESYEGLAAALAEVRARRPDLRWVALGTALRDWAIDRPHEFQLIYGTP
ncbi:MAG TPA: TetR/AcrR family transcriptional regulator, partial [Candidatus Janibacter merdipullorum]|nr:TetR/AcrR family transcriptional regulator [Candidatus Janibacter merdipullorum]